MFQLPENRIRQLRKEKGLTLKELSRQLKEKGTPLSASSLIKYERGERNPKLETWIKLADFFDVPIPYLQGTVSINPKEEIKKIGNPFEGSEREISEKLRKISKLISAQAKVEFPDTKTLKAYFEILHICLDGNTTIFMNDNSEYLKKLSDNLSATDYVAFVGIVQSVLSMFLYAQNKHDKDSIECFNELCKVISKYNSADHSEIS